MARNGFSEVFLSTPSARRATFEERKAFVYELFLSTPSARRATRPAWRLYLVYAISIHALREEGDQAGADPRPCAFDISIHALREEGDEMSDEEKALQNDFYPRPPRGGRPWAKRVLTIWGIFLSTPSARRATHPCRQSSCWQ